MNLIEDKNNHQERSQTPIMGAIKYSIAIALLTTLSSCAGVDYKSPTYRQYGTEQIDPQREAFMKAYQNYINSQTSSQNEDEFTSNIIIIVKDMYRTKQGGIKYFLIDEAARFNQRGEKDKASKCLKLNSIIDSVVQQEEAIRKQEQEIRRQEELERQRIEEEKEHQKTYYEEREIANYDIYIGIIDASYDGYKLDEDKTEQNGRYLKLFFYKKKGVLKKEKEITIGMKYQESIGRLIIEREEENKTKKIDINPGSKRHQIPVDFGKLNLIVKYKEKENHHNRHHGGGDDRERHY